MKKILTLCLLSCFFMRVMSQTANPIANPSAVVQSGYIRFTVLTPQMIRIQYSTKKQFEDRATFAVINRNLPVPEFSTKESDGYLYITTSALTLKYKIGKRPNPILHTDDVLSITFKLDSRNVVWYPGKDDALNLKGTCRTLDADIGDTRRGDLENGLLSRDGWAVVDESPTAKRGDGSTTFAFDKTIDGISWHAAPVDAAAYDWYFMGYGHDYKRALGDYVKIAGREPLPPLYMFGYWYSKYQRYTAQDFMNIVNDVESNDVPLDVMIFDMDWHLDGWTGWTWNKSLIPNPTGLISWMHAHKLKVSLNLHPADGVNSYEDNFANIRNDMKMSADATNVPWQLEDSTFYRTFFKNIIRLRESEGVDFWWLDWQQDLLNKNVSGLGQTFWLNHVFYNDMLQKRPDRRPVIFHRWGGMGSHRYPIGFSGDTFATFGTLAFEPYFTATASNVCFGYWGHDLGGHLQPSANNPELYLRWLQYGVFSPIFRTHGASTDGIERRIWKYDNFQLMLDAVNLRYTLVPYIYTAARKAYDTGVSLCRPLYYEYPEDNRSYVIGNEYFFGDDILVAPVVSEGDGDGMADRDIWLPEGEWFDVARNRLVEGNVEYTDRFAQDEIPYFYKAGSIIPCNPSMKNLKTAADVLELKVVPGGDGEGSLYEDAGDNESYKEGAFATTLFRQQRDNSKINLTINPRVGLFPEMSDSRAYKILFLAEARPSSIKVNGETTETWTFDEMSKTVTLSLPATLCSATINIELNRSATSVKPANIEAPELYYLSADEMLTASFPVASRVRMSVVSLDGSEVAAVHQTDSNSLALNLSGLPSGPYICRLNADGNVVTRKIMK